MRAPHQDPESRRRPPPLQSRLPGPHVPCPSVPWAMNPPRDPQIFLQVFQQALPEKLDTRNAVGAKSITAFELLVPLLTHRIAMLAPLIHRRIEHHDLSPRP